MSRTLLALLALSGMWLACLSEEPAGLSREEFVRIYVRLIRARVAAAGDSAAYAAARENIFNFAKVDAEDMRRFVDADRQHPEELRAAWQAVAAKLDTLYGGVTSAAPAGLQETLAPGVLGDTLGRTGAEALPDTFGKRPR